MVTATGSRILVIEHDPDISFLILARLRQAGHAVEVADDAEAAVRHCSGDSPPELLLVHLGLPATHGFDVVEQIRALDGCRDVRVIVFSALISEADIARAHALGAHCLSKPFAASALLRGVEAVLAA